MAIKEFLGIIKPELIPLLLEVPSPPLRKLYGILLEEYAKERSPKLSKLVNGQATRNNLVHRPESIKLETEETNNYIRDVEIAIFHLLYLLDPNDYLVKEIQGSYQIS